PRQVAEAEVVVLPSVRPPPGLEHADGVVRHVPPVAARRRVQLHEALQVLVRAGVRHRDVAGQRVEQRRHVRRSLDRRVTAQRECWSVKSSSGGSPWSSEAACPPCPACSPYTAPISRWPAAPWTLMPAYCHVAGSYSPFSASHPEKKPSRSSVSLKPSWTITG